MVLLPGKGLVQLMLPLMSSTRVLSHVICWGQAEARQVWGLHDVDLIHHTHTSNVTPVLQWLECDFM